MEHFLLSLLKLSAIGGLVIAAALLTRPLWRERYRAKTRRALWLALAILLLLPLDYSLPVAPLQVAAPPAVRFSSHRKRRRLCARRNFSARRRARTLSSAATIPLPLRLTAPSAWPTARRSLPRCSARPAPCR